MISRKRKFLLLLLVVQAAFLNWYCGNTSKKEAQDDPQSRTTYAGLSADARYVGMATCSGCHPDIHRSFSHTGMGMSFDTASREKSSGDFLNHPVVYDKFKNLSYHPYWSGEQLRFLEYRLSEKDTIHKRDVPISYIVGSGQHTNSHMWSVNGYVYQAPMTFYTQKKQWDLPPGFENGDNSRFSRLIGLECMTCHNGYPEFVLGSENKYNKVQNGIDCERCHGPGSIHVAEKSKGVLIDTSKFIDYSIVNPSKLPIDLQFDVCQRCHVQGNAVLVDGKSFLDFKPGMKLSDVMNVFMPVYENNENSHIMASHAERLKMSKCFVETDAMIRNLPKEKAGLKPYTNGLTCITCHNPHVSVKETGVNIFNTACANCHQPNKHPCTESETKRKESANNCVSCHMPGNSTLDIPHVSVHDHRIGIHKSNPADHRALKFMGINCINNPKPPAEAVAQAYINYVEKFGMDIHLLDSAMKYMDVQTETGIRNNIHRLIQIAFLKKDYPAIINYSQKPGLKTQLVTISYDNRDAWTSYRIAEAYNTLNRKSDALQWFANAHKLAPFHAEFSNKYGTALAAVGQLDQADEVFTKLVKDHPEYAPGYCNLGFLKLSHDRNVAEAGRLLDIAISLDPDYELALLNKANVFIVQGNIKDATRMLNRVLKINPANEQARMGLRQLLLQ